MGGGREVTKSISFIPEDASAGGGGKLHKEENLRDG
jgi:hypothetical protein